MSGFRIQLEICSVQPCCKFTPVHPYSSLLNDAYKSFSGDLRFYEQSKRRWAFKIQAYKLFLATIKAKFPSFEVEELPKHLLKFLKSDEGQELTSLGSVASSQSQEEAEDALCKISHKFQENLYPYQQEGFKFAIERNGRVLIGDDMGLGKTAQALAVSDYYRDEWPLLIICPSAVRFNWKIEILNWLDGVSEQDVTVVVNAKTSLESKICVVSYDLLAALEKKGQLWAGKFQVVVADESHSMKNPEAKRTKAALPILTGAKRALLLSGTPALSRPAELWPQLCALRQRLFPSFHRFADRYCDGKQGPFGYEAKGATRVEELKTLLGSLLMIRRMKEDYPDALPSKDREFVEVAVDPAVMVTFKEIQEKEKEIKRQIDETPLDDEGKLKYLDILKKNCISEMYRLSGKAKMQAVIAHLLELLGIGKCESSPFLEDVEDAIDLTQSPESEALVPNASDGAIDLTQSPHPKDDDESSSAVGKTYNAAEGGSGASAVEGGSSGAKKIVVFCHSMVVMDALEEALAAAGVALVRMDGKTGSKKRQELVDRFQSQPKIRAAILSMTACGAGITLTAAQVAVFAELHWTPGLLRQCEDRIHRVGQAQSVVIQYLVNKTTSDTDTLSLIQRKSGLLGASIGQASSLNSTKRPPMVTNGHRDIPRQQQTSHQQQSTLHGFFKSVAATPSQLTLPKKTYADASTVANSKPAASGSNIGIPVLRQTTTQSQQLSPEVQEKIRRNREAALKRKADSEARKNLLGVQASTTNSSFSRLPQTSSFSSPAGSPQAAAGAAKRSHNEMSNQSRSGSPPSRSSGEQGGGGGRRSRSPPSGSPHGAGNNRGASFGSPPSGGSHGAGAAGAGGAGGGGGGAAAVSSSSSSAAAALSPEQRARAEANRRRALALRAERERQRRRLDLA